ncbi:hypothetical protein FHL15_010872 [Xylaria flabelliformis]|uniref:Uncharacterized protein n=1 Tax=Xylaria flabelliformis TaxID=2512241 RepID=A0A553HJX5_9PEZI|nr:hypothetical protein FHL15_010872 [Xylaria flabelliformis]
MDDPWGSPWASNDAPAEIDPPSSSRTNAFLSPPPKVFFGNGTSLPTQSPWSGNRDDDGFNIWTAPDRADGADSQKEWGAWGESGAQPPRLSPRLSASGKESPLAWPENAAASPVFLGNSRPRTPSILRHNSPDPWATELSFTTRSDLELPNSSKAVTSNVPTIETGQVEQASQVSHIAAEIGTGEKTNDRDHLTKEEFAIEGARTYEKDSDPRTGLGLVYEDTNARSKRDPTSRKPPSRSSSACTLDSHDGPDRQDSPITSIDEDRGTRIQNSMRKTSGKVQDLVGIYDDLARAVSEEPPSLDQHEASRTTSREKSQERRGFEDDDGGGFGDFEDAFANANGATISPGEASFSSEFSSTPKAETKDMFTQEPRHGGEEHGTSITETPYAQEQKAPNKFRDIIFDTHLADLNKLFPDLPDSLHSDSTENWEVSDHVVSDSFATISERKSWYRISRYGSMRKHNSGDDENYHRVTWQTSQLHDDIVKIVRRWMEEDSYAGKAILGGTKRTGFFDWDSDAAPVKLDEVFRRKKSLTKHTRTTSIPAGSTVIQNTSAIERPYRNSTGISLSMELSSGSQPITPVPSFGWNSEAPATRPVHQNRNPAPAPTTTPGETASRRLEPIQITSTDEEEDDDWGEMVSSPRVAETNVETSISAFLPQTPTENNEPTPRSSLAISNIDKPTELTSPPPKATQLPPSDPWLFSDFSVFDKLKEPHGLPGGHASQVAEGHTVLESNSILHDHNSLDASSSKASLADVPFKGTADDSNPLNLPRNESQDDIIVHRILQSLPDLSYMLR